MFFLAYLFCAAIREYIWSKRKPVRTSFVNLPANAHVEFTHFSPSWWIPHSLGQVIASRVLPAPKVDFVRHTTLFSDGVVCCLDVVHSNVENKGTILFCPGFSGNIHSPYCSWFADLATSKGYNVVVYNRRAHVAESVSDTYPLHYDQDDLNIVLDWIDHNFEGPLFGVGISGGGNTLMKHIGDFGKTTTTTDEITSSQPFKAVVSVGNGYDVDASVNHIEATPLTNRVSVNFAREILENVKGGGGSFAPREEMFSALERKALSTFNHQTTYMPHYYKSMSCSEVLEHIDIPMLCINSLDDLLMFHDAEYYTNMVVKNPKISLILTSHGGHVGYVDKSWKCIWWCENVMAYIDSQNV